MAGNLHKSPATFKVYLLAEKINLRRIFKVVSLAVNVEYLAQNF